MYLDTTDSCIQGLMVMMNSGEITASQDFMLTSKWSPLVTGTNQADSIEDLWGDGPDKNTFRDVTICKGVKRYQLPTRLVTATTELLGSSWSILASSVNFCSGEGCIGN